MNPIALVLVLVPLFPPLFPAAFTTQEEPAPTREAPTLAAERRELAEIRLLVAADRQHTKAKERLAGLKTLLAARADPDAKDLLAEVERLDQDVRRALGETVPAALANAGQDKVDEAVLAALQREDFAFVGQLGKRAVPGLVQAVRADLDQLPGDMEKDPLVKLVRIDPLAASRLAGELLGQSGFFWKKRVARILEDGLTGNADLWTAASPQRWLGEGLAKTAEKYAEDADVGQRAFLFLCALAGRGETLPTFPAILGRALRSDDPARRGAAKNWAARNPRVLGLSGFTALLDEPDEDLRALAVEALARHFPEDRNALARVDDPSPAVRLEVAEWLSRIHDTTWQAEERRVLARLLVDSNERVRKEAWKRLHNMTREVRTFHFSAAETFSERDQETRREVVSAPLPDDAYRSLLQSAERAGLCSIALRLEAPLCFELLSALASEDDPGVLRELVAELASAPKHEDPAAALHLATLLFDNDALTERGALRDFVSGLNWTRSGLEALARWALARSDDEGFQALIHRNDSSVFPKLSELDPQLVTACLARVYSVQRTAIVEQVERERMAWSPELASALRALAREAGQPIELRVLALRESLRKAETDDEHVQIALAILDDPAWRRWESADDATAALQRLLARRERLANPLALRALRDPGLPEEVPAALAATLVPEEAGAAEIVSLVLAHWPGAECWYDPVVNALNAMGRVPALQDPAFLARAVHDARLGSIAFSTLGRLRDPGNLPLLAEIVARPENEHELEGAARALIGYLDEGAVEPLLAAAAKVTKAETRDACLAHLEKIREYQDSKERWATRKVRAQTREQVIAELVEQLGAKSDEVKVQAIRALATWEAVEVMPRLIELTSSGSKSVAAAAREALDRLNAPEKD